MTAPELGEFIELWPRIPAEDKEIVLSFVLDNMPADIVSKYINMLSFETREFILENFN